MIIIGHKQIKSEKVFCIKSKDDIKNTVPNSCVAFSFDMDILAYCETNSVACAVYVTNIKNAVFANALNAKYILCQKDSVKEIQNIANEYMFDTKVLQIISDENEIEIIAKNGIDGIIFENTIKGLV